MAGGSWKVAYADFVTAMMAFFLLMWILNAASEETKSGLSEFFTEGGISTDGKEPAPGPSLILRDARNFATGQGLSEIENTHKAIAVALQQLIPEDRQTNTSDGVSYTSTGVLLHLTANMLFEPGSVNFTPEGLRALEEVVAVMRKYTVYLIVRGHTSTDETGAPDFPSKWELSSARATATVRHLTQQGVNPAFVRAVAYADTRPIVPDNDPQASVINRRVEFFFHRPEVPAIMAGY